MSSESFPITPEHCVGNREASCEEKADRSAEELWEFIAGRAGDNGVLFANDKHPFKLIAKGGNNKIAVEDASSIGDFEAKTFRSVVLMEVLENVSHVRASEVLRQGWELLKKRGRLFVIERNKESCGNRAGAGCFKIDRLTKMLRPFGRGVVLGDQPFKWVVICVRKHIRAASANSSKDKRLRITAELCKGKVLEFGCGRGELSERIHYQGLVVVGVDKNPNKIAQARKNCPGVEFVNQDVLELPFESECFDTVALPEILEHVPESVGEKMLESAWRFLKPGGRLVVSVPNENCVPCRTHVRQFSRSSLSTILSRFAKPQVETRQPYKWLIMYVEKKSIS